MIYTHEDKHPIVKVLKKKGWVLFDVTAARVTGENGMYGGWWIDCAVAYGTEHYESHKTIHALYLGDTLRDSLKNVRSNKFPNLKNYD